jgi:hypothetical protein
MEYDESRVRHLDDSTKWPEPLNDEPDLIETPATTSRSRRVAAGAGLVAGGLLAGTIGITAVQAATGSTKTQQPAASSQGASQQGSGTVPQGGPAGGFGGGGIGGGGVAGEQRLSGTVARVFSNAISVKTSSGTSTYGVNGTTDIRRDGQAIALSALKVGETVTVHLIPSGSSFAVERILAGTGGFGGPGGPPPGGGTAPDGTTSSGTARAT